MTVYPNDWRRKLRELQVKRYKKERIYERLTYILFYIANLILGAILGAILEHNFHIMKGLLL
jgi:hypothetical protein